MFNSSVCEVKCIAEYGIQLYNKSCQLTSFLRQTNLVHLGSKREVERPMNTIATNSASSYLERMLRLARQ